MEICRFDREEIMKVINILDIFTLTKLSKDTVNLRWLKNPEIITKPLELDCFIKTINVPFLLDRLTFEELEFPNNTGENIKLVNELANSLARNDIYLNRFELIDYLDLEINSEQDLTKLINDLLNNTINIYKDFKLIQTVFLDLMEVYIDDEEESRHQFGHNKIKSFVLSNNNYMNIPSKFGAYEQAFKDWLFNSLNKFEIKWCFRKQYNPFYLNLSGQTNFDERYKILRKKKIYEKIYGTKMPSSEALNQKDFLKIDSF